MRAIGAAPLRKSYRYGTHRAVPPTETLARFLPLAERMGITRIANVTGLDRLEIPVVMATRPDARSLSVAQGKGLDLSAAKTSAFMEAAEAFHAENVQPSILGAPLSALGAAGTALAWRRLPRTRGRRFSEKTPIAWMEGRRLPDGEPIFVPYDLVHLDYRVAVVDPRGAFPLASNGLASGNDILEATCAALFELVERDATTLWARGPAAARASCLVDPENVDHATCRALIERLVARGMAIKIWDVTTDIGVAAFLCELSEVDDGGAPRLTGYHGSGCHLARDIALLRALTEAVQTRLTYIAGSRDDLHRRNYLRTPDETVLSLMMTAWEKHFPRRRFGDVPHVETESFEADLEMLLERLRAVGVDQVIAVDLTRADFGLPVVRVVAPGLEFIDEDPRYVPGPRARRVMALPT